MEIEESSNGAMVTLASIKFGSLFKYVGDSKTVYMKVKAVNFLNNSNLLSDVFSRGDCLTVAMARGSLSIAKGSHEVIIMHGNLKVRPE